MRKLIDQLPTILEEAWLKQFPEIKQLAEIQKITVLEFVFDAVKNGIEQEEVNSVCHKLNICPHYIKHSDVTCYENDANELMLSFKDQEMRVKFCPFCGHKGNE